jgi:hypothetical protein
MSWLVSPYPSAEALVIEILSAQYAGQGYSIATETPAQLPTIAIRVETITGHPLNIRLDEPVVEIDVITSKHISGDAGYGIADVLAHQIWADLYNSRGQQFTNGTISLVKTVAGPRRVVDINVDTFRFAATYQLTIHA